MLRSRQAEISTRYFVRITGSFSHRDLHLSQEAASESQSLQDCLGIDTRWPDPNAGNSLILRSFAERLSVCIMTGGRTDSSNGSELKHFTLLHFDRRWWLLLASYGLVTAIKPCLFQLGSLRFFTCFSFSICSLFFCESELFLYSSF